MTKPTDIRTLAVEIVDMIHGCTMEFSSHPAAHADEYDRVEDHLSDALAVEAGATATELDVSLALYELITLAKGDGIRSVTDPAYTDRLFTEEQAYRLILSALTPASSGVEGEAVAIWVAERDIRYVHSNEYIRAIAAEPQKTDKCDFPLYAHPAPTPAEEWPLEDLTRPIFGIENRTAQEVFDIMADRIRLASPAPHQEGRADG